MAAMKECLAEAKVTEEEMKNFMANGMKPSDAKDNIKCHMKCMMEHHGTFKNGAFLADAAVANLKKMPGLQDKTAEIQAAVEACKNEKGANECDTAYKITTCLRDHKAAA